MNAAAGIGLLLCGLSLACATPSASVSRAPTGRANVQSIAEVLDGFHMAASKADEEAYFGAFAESAIFLGTDASERWDMAGFRAYVHPHFSQGRGFTYIPRARHIVVHESGQSAWFDELLDHENYGELRGSGVLVLEHGTWKIAQYNLTFTIPNAKSKSVVSILKESPAPPAP
jgi:hypothetical protein